MPTNIQSLLPSLQREVNPPGAENFATATPGDLLGYLEDGFWEARLLGMLSGWTIKTGDEIVPPVAATQKFLTDHAGTADFPEHLRMLIVIAAAVRLLRLRILQLAINFAAKAGPVEYEQQASATTLRAVLATLEGRLAELKDEYSTLIGGGAFIYFDSVLQRAQSELDGALNAQVV